MLSASARGVAARNSDASRPVSGVAACPVPLSWKQSSGPPPPGRFGGLVHCRSTNLCRRCCHDCCGRFGLFFLPGVPAFLRAPISTLLLHHPVQPCCCCCCCCRGIQLLSVPSSPSFLLLLDRQLLTDDQGGSEHCN